MATKLVSPNTTIWWVDTTGTFLATAPDASNLVADLGSGKAFNISAAVATGYTLNATASDTDNSKTIVDEGNSQSRGNGNYSASIPLYREADPVTNTDSVFLAAYNLFKAKGASGTLVKRLGYKYTVAPAAGQLVSVYTVLSDNPRDEESDAGGPIRLTVPFFAQGYMKVNVALVA